MSEPLGEASRAWHVMLGANEVKLDKAAKVFAKKFSCGCSVAKGFFLSAQPVTGHISYTAVSDVCRTDS